MESQRKKAPQAIRRYVLTSKYDMYLNEDSIAKSQEENKLFHSNSLPILCETQFASKWSNFSWPTVMAGQQYCIS